jgi:predicted regulator of Ras-like GTPase activity (Roadblock/LC7/MglB family)
MSLHDLAKRTAPQHLITSSSAILQNTLVQTPGITRMMLCSTDGFELVTHSHDANTISGGKMAAVSSSILAMVHAFMREIQLEGCQSITLDADNGQAIITSLPYPNYPMVLVTLSSKDILLGQLRFSVKHCCDEILKMSP